jgi:hypothetical protein
VFFRSGASGWKRLAADGGSMKRRRVRREKKRLDRKVEIEPELQGMLEMRR